VSDEPISQGPFGCETVQEICILIGWDAAAAPAFRPPAGAALFAIVPSAGKASCTFEHRHVVTTDPWGAFSDHGMPASKKKWSKDIAECIRGESLGLAS